jgi:hypothetical protein
VPPLTAGDRASFRARAPVALDVLGEFLGEGAQDAAHEEPFLDCEVLAVPICDPLEPPLDGPEVAVAAGPCRDAL